MQNLFGQKFKQKNNPDLYICSFYRPPTDETGLTHLRHSISRISQNGKHNIWIAGDFNCPKINWTSLTCPENDKTSTNLLDLTKDFHLHQAVREPTRGKNILELFLTTNPSLVEITHSIPGISDHDSIPLLNKPAQKYSPLTTTFSNTTRQNGNTLFNNSRT